MSLFRDDFYTVIGSSHTETAFNFTIRINANHGIFDGHFPQNPVTPGVVQLEIIKELLSEGLGRAIHLVSLSNCKYLAILNPNTCGDIHVNIEYTLLDTGVQKAVVLLKNNEITFLKASGTYK